MVNQKLEAVDCPQEDLLSWRSSEWHVCESVECVVTVDGEWTGCRIDHRLADRQDTQQPGWV